MYSSAAEPVGSPRHDKVDNERVLSLYGIILATLPSFGVLFFWTIGAVGLLTGQGGQILDLQLTGIWRTAFLAMPVVALVCLVGAVALFALRRHKEAAGLAGLPVLATLAYYFALVLLR